jgi:hypothetical protein
VPFHYPAPLANSPCVYIKRGLRSKIKRAALIHARRKIKRIIAPGTSDFTWMLIGRGERCARASPVKSHKSGRIEAHWLGSLFRPRVLSLIINPNASFSLFSFSALTFYYASTISNSHHYQAAKPPLHATFNLGFFSLLTPRASPSALYTLYNCVYFIYNSNIRARMTVASRTSLNNYLYLQNLIVIIYKGQKLARGFASAKRIVRTVNTTIICKTNEIKEALSTNKYDTTIIKSLYKFKLYLK